MDLAESLSGMNEKLTKYIHINRMAEKADAEKEAKALWAGMTEEKAEHLQREGKLLAHENPYVNQHLSVYFAQMLGERRFRDLSLRQVGTSTSNDPTQPNFYDREKGQPIDDWAKGEMSQDIQRLQGNEAKAAYASVMEKGLSHLKSAEAQRLAQTTEAHAQTATYDVLYRTAKDEIERNGGKYNPDTLADAMVGKYDAIKKTFGLDEDKVDAVMFRVIPSLAKEGHFGLVDSLLKRNQRFVAKAGSQAQDWLEEGQKEYLKKARADNIDSRVWWHDRANQGLLNEPEFAAWRKANPNLINDHEAESYILHGRQVARANQEAALAAQAKAAQEMAYQQQEQGIDAWGQRVMDAGGLAHIRPMKTKTKTGEASEIGVESQQERYISNFIDQVLPRRQIIWAQQKGVAPDGPEATEWAFQHRLEVMSRNGVADPQWKRVLNNGVAAANLPNLTAENMPAVLTSGYQLYRELSAKAPQSLGHLVPDTGTMEFYEMARIAQEHLGQDERNALITASSVVRGTAEVPPHVLQARNADLEKAMKRMQGTPLSERFGAAVGAEGAGSTFSNLFGNGVINANVAAPAVERLAKAYIRLGFNNDDAIKWAAERLRPQYANINGTLVYTNDARIKSFPSALKAADKNAEPTDFATAARNYLGDWATAHGDVSASDIGIFQYAPGTYIVIHKDGINRGLPVTDIGGKNNPIFTLDDLMQNELKRQSKTRAKEQNEVIQEQATRYDPWFTNDVFAVGPFNIHGFTPEETKIIDQRREEQRKNKGLTESEVDAAGRFGGRRH